MQSLIASRAERFSNSVQHAAYHSSLRSNDNPAETIEMIGTDVPFAKSAQIYGEGEPSVYLYKITSRPGAVLQDDTGRTAANRRFLCAG